MKKLAYLITLFCIALFSACSSDDDALVGEENAGDGVFGKEIIIGAGMPDDESTRVSFDDSNLKDGLRWQEGDKLLLVGLKNKGREGYEIIGTSDFELIEGAGQRRGIFKGRTLKNADKYQVFYKGNLKFSKDRFGITYVDMDYTGVSQNGFNTTSHLRNYLFLAVSNLQAETTERRFIPLALSLDELLKDNVNLTLLNSYLRIDVRALPKNLENARQVRWLINNDTGDNSYSNSTQVFGVLNFKAEIKDIRANKDAHQYLYIPFKVIDQQFMHKERYIALEFSDRYITTRSASHREGDGILIRPGKRYNVNVSVHQDGIEDDPHALYNWDGFEEGEIPDFSKSWSISDKQIRVKFVEGMKPLESLEDSSHIKYTFVSKEDGWCTYETKERIENANGLINPEHAKSIVGLQSPLHVRVLRDGVCKDFTNLKELLLSPYVQKIGVESFSGCTSLKKIEIPYCTRIIKKGAFAGFTGDEIIIHAPEKQLSVCETGAFSNTENCTLRLHESWYPYMKSHPLRWAGYEFKKVIYIDDDGNDVTGPIN